MSYRSGTCKVCSCPSLPSLLPSQYEMSPASSVCDSSMLLSFAARQPRTESIGAVNQSKSLVLEVASVGCLLGDSKMTKTLCLFTESVSSTSNHLWLWLAIVSLLCCGAIAFQLIFLFLNSSLCILPIPFLQASGGSYSLDKCPPNTHALKAWSQWPPAHDKIGRRWNH